MEVKNGDKSLKLLALFLDAQGIAKDARPVLIAKINAIVQSAKSSDLPKWQERHNYPELKNLSAVQFLRHVHADSIVDNTVFKEIIRRIDPPLMNRIESYVSQREGRNQDRGEAEGLVFISHNLAGNSRMHRLREPS